MIKERILQFIDYKGDTKYKFYQKTGFANGFLDKEGNIGSDKCEKIYYEYPDLSLDWLITGKGNMLKGVADIPVTSAKSVETTPATPLQGVPLLPLDAFAGVGSDIEGVNFDTIEERYIIPLFNGIKVDFMISVRGASMYPKYNSGDVVACKFVRELLFVQWNKVYVLDTISQGVIIKRLKKSDNEGFIICKSDNESYEPFEIPLSDVRSIALVVGVCRLE